MVKKSKVSSKLIHDQSQEKSSGPLSPLELTRVVNFIELLAKIDRRITDSDYDKFYQRLRGELNEVKSRLESLDKAQDDYYSTAAYTLALCQNAYKLFMGSEVEEKRQLINLVLSNLKVDAENIVYEAQKPFNLLLKCSEDIEWRP